MPQADENLRQEWGGQDGIGEDKAEDYLKGKGYTLSRYFIWILPNPNHVPTKEELGAIGFLIDEWDYGGWVRTKEELKRENISSEPVSTSSIGNEPWG